MKTFITHKDRVVGPEIEACDHAHAQMLAEDIDEDLIVDGELRLTIISASMTPNKADNMIKAMTMNKGETK